LTNQGEREKVNTLFSFQHLLGLKKKKKKNKKWLNSDLEIDAALTKVGFEYSLNFLAKE
jgi:hypothetical protein